MTARSRFCGAAVKPLYYHSKRGRARRTISGGNDVALADPTLFAAGFGAALLLALRAGRAGRKPRCGSASRRPAPSSSCRCRSASRPASSRSTASTSRFLRFRRRPARAAGDRRRLDRHRRSARGPSLRSSPKGAPEIGVAAMADAPYSVLLAVLKDSPIRTAPTSRARPSASRARAR